MTRTNYLPALAAVYLDQKSQDFLLKNTHLEFWKIFFDKIRNLFASLPIHIIVSKELNSVIESEMKKEQNIFLHVDVDTEETFLKKISTFLPTSKFNDPDWDEVCFLYFKGISPLIDLKLVAESWERHKKFFSQYSYSENLPEGVIPYILTREFLSSLPDKLSTDVHSFFLKNINQYDVDIFYVPPDLRQYRFDLRLNDFRNLNLIENLLKKDPKITYEELLPTIQKNAKIFRFAPSYIEWEIYKGCELDCIFCPRQFVSKENEPNQSSLENIINSISKLQSAIPTDFTICFGGNGEPLLHPNFTDILTHSLKIPNLTELIVETALYTNVDTLVESISKMDENSKKKLCIIVNLSTLKKDIYRKLYGKDIHTEILNSIDKLRSILPKSSLHIQMIKMIEVGDEVEAFFNYFEKKDINVILQKFNSFAGKLPEKRVSDLTPIHREFCWHLNRDLVIDVNGNVSICKQTQTEVLGNIIEQEFSEIWEKGQKYFEHSLLGDHKSIPAPCLNCDEWYTFNA